MTFLKYHNVINFEILLLYVMTNLLANLLDNVSVEWRFVKFVSFILFRIRSRRSPVHIT